MTRLYFDRRDHQLLEIVNDVLTRDKSRKEARKLVFPYLHPHGIKEMAESRGLRIAYAVIHLLESLEAGSINDRLSALQSLHDELQSTPAGPLPRNTSRVLIEIMKELVRAHGDTAHQLGLAHDFRTVAAGNPRIVRAFLRRYHLLEMPEEWNQLTFDDHVHDANTKGRKSSSHLIMDAWIKGIRRLRVIYYNFLEPMFAIELLEAARIMGITVRIGIEFSVRFHDRFAQLIWVPRGFPDSESFLCFLAEESVIAFMAEGRKVSTYQQQYVLSVLEAFNERHRRKILESHGLDLPPIDRDAFLAFVGTGQASLIHLAEFIHIGISRAMEPIQEELRRLERDGNTDECLENRTRLERLDLLDAEAIEREYLKPEKNPGLFNPFVPSESADEPDLLKLSARELIHRLSGLHSAFRVTLNLSHLSTEDVLEILYDCEGQITRLEIFNLKDFYSGKSENIPEISRLQQDINEGKVVNLKRSILSMIQKMERADNMNGKARAEILSGILHDIAGLTDMYKGTPLKARIGSDSTGRSRKVPGMGLVIRQTLPFRARRETARVCDGGRDTLPVQIRAFRRITHIPRKSGVPFFNALFGLLRHVPLLGLAGETRREDWVFQDQSIEFATPGNVVTLGGVRKNVPNNTSRAEACGPPKKEKTPIKYLNTGFKNVIKVLVGFVPAFLTFYLTKEWWVLAYGGAFIWFGITGLRNVLQSVLGGGGLRRSPLLRWNDYVSWTRITDSLLYTGFSVPLLDYLVKTLLLDKAFGINTTTSPMLLYAVMGLTNGLYLSSHNAFRGLPSGAVMGNFFRSILSIPIAIGLNTFIGSALGAFGVVAVNEILQKWAAVISKFASDVVAGVIEGLADRSQNIRMRWRDYREKIRQVFETYGKLELLLPDSDVRELLKSPERFREEASAEVRDFEKILIINALDLLYFWMYQPRARTVLRAILKTYSPEEREVLMLSHNVLQEKKSISLLLVEGLVGKNFSRALSFYLDREEEYRRSLARDIPPSLIQT